MSEIEYYENNRKYELLKVFPGLETVKLEQVHSGLGLTLQDADIKIVRHPTLYICRSEGILRLNRCTFLRVEIPPAFKETVQHCTEIEVFFVNAGTSLLSVYASVERVRHFPKLVDLSFWSSSENGTPAEQPKNTDTPKKQSTDFRRFKEYMSEYDLNPLAKCQMRNAIPGNEPYSCALLIDRNHLLLTLCFKHECTDWGAGDEEEQPTRREWFGNGDHVQSPVAVLSQFVEYLKNKTDIPFIPMVILDDNIEVLNACDVKEAWQKSGIHVCYDTHTTEEIKPFEDVLASLPSTLPGSEGLDVVINAFNEYSKDADAVNPAVIQAENIALFRRWKDSLGDSGLYEIKYGPCHLILIRNGQELTLVNFFRERFGDSEAWLADEEIFNGQIPLWFSVSANTESPVFISMLAAKYLETFCNCKITSVVVLEDWIEIINADDVTEVWREMNVAVCYHSQKTEYIKSFVKILEEMRQAQDEKASCNDGSIEKCKEGLAYFDISKALNWFKSNNPEYASTIDNADGTEDTEDDSVDTAVPADTEDDIYDGVDDNTSYSNDKNTYCTDDNDEVKHDDIIITLGKYHTDLGIDFYLKYDFHCVKIIPVEYTDIESSMMKLEKVAEKLNNEDSRSAFALPEDTGVETSQEEARQMVEFANRVFERKCDLSCPDPYGVAHESFIVSHLKDISRFCESGEWSFFKDIGFSKFPVWTLLSPKHELAFVYYYPSEIEWRSNFAELLYLCKKDREEMQNQNLYDFYVYSVVIVPVAEEKNIRKYAAFTEALPGESEIFFATPKNINETIARLILRMTE